MHVSVTTTKGLQRRMTVAVPADVIEEQIRDRLKSMAGRVKVDGFRPGRVPMSVVERRFGKQVRSEVQQDLMQKSFSDAVLREQLRPVGQPRIELSKAAPGEPLEFTATFEVFPQVELTLPGSFDVERPAVTIGDADVDAVVERIRKQNISWRPVDRAARDGDRVNIDFRGTIGGEPFDGGEAKDYELVLGSSTLVGDFEKQLEGAAPGAFVTVTVTFPDTYPVERLAKQVAQFAVTVNQVSEPVLPELDDAFFARFGVTSGGLESFRQQVRDNIDREVNTAVKARVKEQVIEALLKAVPVELPQVLVESEIFVRMQRMRTQLTASGIAEKDIRLERSVFEESSRRAVAVGLIVSEIVRRNGLKVSADQLRAKVEELAAGYEDPAAVVSWYYGDRERLGNVEAVMLEDRAIDWALTQANIVDKPTPVMELLDRSAAA